MIIYDANNPNRTGRKGEGRPLDGHTITTLDDGSLTLLGGDSTRPDPELLDLHRPPQRNFKGESIGNIKLRNKEIVF